VSTLFILVVFAWFVLVAEVDIREKLVLAGLFAAVSLLPLAVPHAALWAAIGQGLLGVYVCLRMTYLRARARLE